MKKAIYILAALLIIIQFIPVNFPEASTVNPNDLILNNKDIPEVVQLIIKNSCYDCHSNETKYPWYSHVAPVSFLVSRDVKNGRNHINFSIWETYKKTERAKILDEMSEYVTNGEMPMPIYTLIHRNAALSDEEKEILVTWTEEFAESMFE